MDAQAILWTFSGTRARCVAVKDLTNKLRPTHNPSVVGSFPTDPTNCPSNECKEYSLRVLYYMICGLRYSAADGARSAAKPPRP